VWWTVVRIMSFLKQMEICLIKEFENVDGDRPMIAVRGRRVFASFRSAVMLAGVSVS
jgi:hypothetical protein